MDGVESPVVKVEEDEHPEGTIGEGKDPVGEGDEAVGSSVH